MENKEVEWCDPNAVGPNEDHGPFHRLERKEPTMTEASSATTINDLLHTTSTASIVQSCLGNGEIQDDLAAVAVEDVEVKKQPTPALQPKVGSKEFCEILYKELAQGKVWRTSKALAEKLNVDVVELDTFLRSQHVVCARSSKEEGVFLYALLKRLEEPPQSKDAAKVEAQLRPLVSEDDRYALATIHSAYLLLEAALQKYALRVHERNPEAFTNLVAGKDKLEAGIVLFANKIKAELSKLPKV